MLDDELRALARAANLTRLVVQESDVHTHPDELRYYVSAYEPALEPEPIAACAGLGIWTHEGVTTKPIAEYIAAACNEVPRLLDEAERLRRGWDQATDLGAARVIELHRMHEALAGEQAERIRRVRLDAVEVDRARRERDALQRQLELTAQVVALASKIASGEWTAAPNVVRAFVNALHACDLARAGSVR